MVRTMARFTYDSDTPQAVAAGGTVQYSSSATANGKVSYDNAGGIVLKEPGTYLVSASLTAVATAIGSIEVQMMENGVYAPGARSEQSVAAVGDFAALSVSDLVTVKPGNSGSFATISLVATAATSVQTANVFVVKIA